MSILDPEYLLYTFLVFVRIAGLVMAAPFYEQKFIPVQVKILFAVLFAYALAGIVPMPEGLTPTVPVALAYYVIIEGLTGVVLGMSARFIFFAIRFAGDFIGLQMAFSISQVISPADGQASNPISNFLIMTTFLLFLILDGHHQMFRALNSSFYVVPLAGADLHLAGDMLLTWTGRLFMTALRLASPFMITIFLVDMTLGIFARVAPQAEIFSLSLSLKLLVGISITFFYIQHFIPVVPEMFMQMLDDMMSMIEAIAPR
ncbi:MAG: flagellar biosynthetic protein FliR [Rhodothermales bacterium]